MTNKFKYGITVPELAKEYSLSMDTVKKIVYSKKDSQELVFYPDINSAKEYNEHLLLEEWVHTYLLFEALLRENVTYYPVIMWCTDKQDYDDFMQKYSPYTDFVLK